ncbi:MAG: hypothetical protein K1X55_14320 [Chitinophagales bacterium]|nr:hypothetical protein [Chitinophagales bacterium]
METLLIREWRYEKLESKTMDMEIAQEYERIKTLPDSIKEEIELRLKDFENMMNVDMKKSTIEFRDDRTFISNNLGENSYGSWRLSEDQRILLLITNIDEKNDIVDSLEIIVIDQTQLKLASNANGDDGVLTLVPNVKAE